MNVNEYLESTRKVCRIKGGSYLETRPRIVCVDGFSLSVQAGEYLYCHPRNDSGPYSAVEVGYPSEAVPEFMEHAESPETPTDTVYGYVPVEVVDAVIAAHGGMKGEK